MAKVEFLLKNCNEKMSFVELKDLRKEYFDLLEENKFPLPPSQQFNEMIHYFKRKDEQSPFTIGPYKNITVFEAANRIASDLVILNGLMQLLISKKRENFTVTIRLGTTHEKNKGDFTIHFPDGVQEEGEAFNVAPSFLLAKLYKTQQKWKNGKLHHILINEEAFQGITRIISDGRIIKVKDWDRDTTIA